MFYSKDVVYAGKTVMVELELTIPPWSGDEGIEIIFEPRLMV